MDTDTWRSMLERTLEDGRLSRSEAQALAAWLADDVPDDDARQRLRSEVFRLARAHATSGGVDGLLLWAERVTTRLDAVRAPAARAVGPTQAFFGPGPDCLGALLAAWRAVRHAADLCVFTITDDRIREAIEAAVRRRVRVRLVTDDGKRDDLGSDVVQLARAGVEVVFDDEPAHMHHKFAVFDGRVLLNGSFNWTRSASEANAENLVRSEEPGLVAAFQAEFDRLWGRLGDVRPGDSR